MAARPTFKSPNQIKKTLLVLIISGTSNPGGAAALRGGEEERVLFEVDE